MFYMMDVDRIMQTAFTKDGSIDQIKNYMFKSGITSSALEHAVPEQLYSTASSAANSISAIKALQLANDQGIPVYTITQSNINTVLPQLVVNDATKSDVINSVNAGKTVIIQKSNVSYTGWSGCGYIILNPDTGAGAYMISSGTSGSYTPNYWSGLDTMVVLNSYTAMEIHTLLDGDAFFDGLYQGFAYLGVVLGFIMDLHHSLNDPNLTTSQRAAAICLLIGIATLSGVAVYLGGVTFWPIVTGIFIMITLNYIREKIMEYIINSSLTERNLKFV